MSDSIFVNLLKRCSLCFCRHFSCATDHLLTIVDIFVSRAKSCSGSCCYYAGVVRCMMCPWWLRILCVVWTTYIYPGFRGIWFHILSLQLRLSCWLYYLAGYLSPYLFLLKYIVASSQQILLDSSGWTMTPCSGQQCVTMQGSRGHWTLVTGDNCLQLNWEGSRTMRVFHVSEILSWAAGIKCCINLDRGPHNFRLLRGPGSHFLIHSDHINNWTRPCHDKRATTGLNIETNLEKQWIEEQVHIHFNVILLIEVGDHLHMYNCIIYIICFCCAQSQSKCSLRTGWWRPAVYLLTRKCFTKMTKMSKSVQLTPSEHGAFFSVFKSIKS